MNRPPYKKLIEHWAKHNVDDFIITSQTENTITSLEAEFDIEFPSDFRDYLLHAHRSDHTMDEDLFEWWSIERIKNENPNIHTVSNQYVVFADYMIWAWAWAICCEKGMNYGRIREIGGKDKFIANNFDEFVTDYLTAPPHQFST